jgi:hypothetical protein
MRQEPIVIALANPTARKRLSEKTNHISGVGSTPEPSVIDEAFARLDRIHGFTTRGETGDGRMMKRSLVKDLAAQLEAIDCQRERLVQLLQSIETNSLAD